MQPGTTVRGGTRHAGHRRKHLRDIRAAWAGRARLRNPPQMGTICPISSAQRRLIGTLIHIKQYAAVYAIKQGATAAYSCHSIQRRLRRKILPVTVLGTSPANSTRRGYL